MKKHSFTLVELLVVVGIIALLAGLIIPAVGMAQTSARRTACLSNQGQVMKIMRAYMNEGDVQFLPSWNSSSSNKSMWTQALYNAGKLQNDISVARCPSILPLQNPEVTNESDASLAEAYGMIYSDQSDVRGIDFKKTRSLRCAPGGSTDPYMVAANQLALGGCSASLDSGRDQIVAKAFINFGLSGNDDNIGRPALVHGDQTNIFFLDGHAEGFTRGALYKKRYYTVVTGNNANDREAIRVGQYKSGNNTNSRDESPAANADWMINPDEAK